MVRSPDPDRLGGSLREAGIGARSYYETPLYAQPAVRQWAPAEPLPNTEAVCAEILALPMGTALDPAVPAAVTQAVRDSRA